MNSEEVGQVDNRSDYESDDRPDNLSQNPTLSAGNAELTRIRYWEEIQSLVAQVLADSELLQVASSISPDSRASFLNGYIYAQLATEYSPIGNNDSAMVIEMIDEALSNSGVHNKLYPNAT